MTATRYLIAGSSHAGLEALHAIRMHDADGSVAMVTRDRHLPYSPTVLPYVVSGRSQPDKVMLRDEAYFRDHDVALVRGAALAAVNPEARTATLESGEVRSYEKLLLATGATPAIPPIDGLSDVPYHVLRTLDDALVLRDAIAKAPTAVVLGAGLVGMHAAENLVAAGLKVTVVEIADQVLPGYFDATAAAMIAEAFTENGAAMRLGRTARTATGDGITLDDGETIACDLLLVATGVKPVIGYLEGSAIDTDQGVLVDDTMATSAADVWAAGDVAQAGDFLGDGKVVNGILPDAVEQGRIAGMAMAGDGALKPYPGGLAINTYTFFGNHAISVGASDDGGEVDRRHDPEAGIYRKILIREDRLRGISAINQPLDAGIMWQLILRGADLSEVKTRFLDDPLETGRALMSETWR